MDRSFAVGPGLAGATTVKSAIKRVERLIVNARIALEAQAIAAVLLAQACRMSKTLVLAVDWSAASPGGSFVELRVVVTWPGAGRGWPVYQQGYPVRQLGNPRIERRMLQLLHSWIVPGVEVIVVADAGFRRPWFAQVRKLGWFFVGRVRQGVSLCDGGCGWQPVAQWFARARRQARPLPGCWLARKAPMACDVVLYRRAPRRRISKGIQGAPASHKAAREARLRESEPWLLVHSPELAHYRPDQIMAFYARRMQIEENFRDSKSPTCGLGFSIGRSRSAERLHALLLIATLAAFLLVSLPRLRACTAASVRPHEPLSGKSLWSPWRACFAVLPIPRSHLRPWEHSSQDLQHEKPGKHQRLGVCRQYCDRSGVSGPRTATCRCRSELMPIDVQPWPIAR